MGRLILVILLLSPFAASAADNGWVLWAKKVETDGNLKSRLHWEIESAFQDFQSCGAAKIEAWEAQLQLMLAMKRNYSNVRDIQSVKGDFVSCIYAPPMDGIVQESSYFYCLPGTLDPRGKQ